MSAPASTSSSGSTARSIAELDPVTRNALRYTISAREYELLHKYLISRAPALKKRTPDPAAHDATAKKDGDYNAATVRLTARVFVASFAGLKTWELIMKKLSRQPVESNAKTTMARHPNLRLALSLSAILGFHRLLYRFFSRLRESLRAEEARPFRRRNPRIARMLTSKMTPAVGASLAGFFLGLSPGDQTRLSIAIYVASRALEFLYNHLDERGYFGKVKPWWFGSWLMAPFAYGQLLHAFVIDRDCFPASLGNFITKRSPEYIQQRPAGYPAHLEWPGTYEIVDALAEISRLNWPPFISPILFPSNRRAALPPKIPRTVSAITDPAHPAIQNLSCAVLHPQDPSCARTYVQYFLRAFPQAAKFFTIVFGLFALPRWRAFVASPWTAGNKLAASILRFSFFVTSAIGSAWASICLLQNFLPRHVLPTSRWFVSGFLAGLWAYVERGSGRDNFLYTARLSADSLWKVGKKRAWWRGVRGGDLLVFVASMMIVDVVYERNPRAVTGGVVRKGLGVLRGEGWVDRALPVKDVEGKAKEGAENEKKEQ